MSDTRQYPLVTLSDTEQEATDRFGIFDTDEEAADE